MNAGVPIEVEMYWKLFQSHYMLRRGLGSITPIPRTAAFISRRSVIEAESLLRFLYVFLCPSIFFGSYIFTFLFLNSDTSKRRLLNEEQLMKVMEGRGFTVTRLSLTNMDSQEAALAIRSSAVLVGAHGAGFANMLYATDSTIVYEMHTHGMQRLGYARVSTSAF